MFKKLTIVLFHIFILLFTSCNIELPKLTELKAKDTLSREVNNLIHQNEGVLSEQYAINPNVTLNYNNGEKVEIHYITFSCYNENLDTLDRIKLDSVGEVLAKIILSNIENDTNFNRIAIEMTKQENSTFTEKEWNYFKEFEIDDLKK